MKVRQDGRVGLEAACRGRRRPSMLDVETAQTLCDGLPGLPWSCRSPLCAYRLRDGRTRREARDCGRTTDVVPCGPAGASEGNVPSNPMVFMRDRAGRRAGGTNGSAMRSRAPGVSRRVAIASKTGSASDAPTGRGPSVMGSPRRPLRSKENGHSAQRSWRLHRDAVDTVLEHITRNRHSGRDSSGRADTLTLLVLFS